MNDLRNKRVLVTGVGIKLVSRVFHDVTSGKPSHTPIVDGVTEYKANIGTAIALECAKAGAVVHMVTHASEKLEIVKRWIESTVPNARIEHTAIDLSNP
ncbi:MAG: hypothetical protein HGA33_06585, partial [Candidatus Moranbacteria bacterium]|nr:hypothetical protein [Candidatus Moranbacteria bacterium]